MHIWEQLPFFLCLMLDGLGMNGKLYYLLVLFCFVLGFLFSFTVSVNAMVSTNKSLCKWIYFNILCATDSFLGQGQALIFESKYAKNNMSVTQYGIVKCTFLKCTPLPQHLRAELLPTFFSNLNRACCLEDCLECPFRYPEFEANSQNTIIQQDRKSVV